MTTAVSPQPSKDTLRPAAPTLAIVVPCYNEEEVLGLAADKLGAFLRDLKRREVVTADSCIYLVDDGSRDSTWSIIERLAAGSADFRGIKLARNFGHQGAVLAGMLEVDADVVATIDADLQDDETCIETMVGEYMRGAEIVYGVRVDRSSDSFGKRTTAESYYRLLHLLGVPVVFNHADYRLMSRRALKTLEAFEETNLFLRGIVPMIGLKTATVGYVRRERAAGVSKYPIRKMFSLAWQGITSFSISPLRFATVTGFALALVSTAFGMWALVVRYLGDGVVPGWASTVIPMYLLGGIQLLFLGIIGEYIGKIYLETKRRPRYLVDAKTWK